MFETLSEFIVRTIQLLFETRINPNTSTYVAFLKLHDVIFELESASKDAFEDFRGYSNGTKIPTNVKYKRKMSRLLDATEGFVAELKSMSSMLSIYNEKLFEYLGGVILVKTSYFELVDIFLETCPAMGEERFLVSYPTNFPVEPFADLTSKVNESSSKFYKRSSINAEGKLFLDNFRNKIKKITVDLRVPTEAHDLFKKAEKNIQEIELARKKLAEFIRDNFPLNTILKTGNSYSEINVGSISGATVNLSPTFGGISQSISGGTVYGGVQALQGDSNQQKMETTASHSFSEEQLTKVDIITLLVNIEQMLHLAKLPAAINEEISTYLNAAKKAAEKNPPKKDIIAINLKGMAETLADASKATDSAKRIWETIKPILSQLPMWLGVAKTFFGF